MNSQKLSKKKLLLIVLSAVAVLLLLVLLMPDMIFRKQIPALPDLSGMPVSLQEQLREAHGNASRKPGVNNLGLLAIAFHTSAQYDNAEECYKLAVRRNSSKWIWSYYLGYLYKEMGNAEETVESFKRVLRENPVALHSWYYIGEGYQNLGMNDEAEEAFARIQSFDGIGPDINSYYRNDYYPLSTYSRYQLARLYINTRRAGSAESILNQIISDNETFGPAYRLLGSVSRMKGDSLASIYYINRANELPDNTSPVDTLIDILNLRSRSDLYILKRIDEAGFAFHHDWALVLVNNALNYLPDNKYLISRAVKLLIRTGAGEDAISYLDRHIRFFSQDFEELKQVADLLYENRYYPESGVYYRKALELRPQSTGIQANLIMGILNEGDHKQAEDLLEEFTAKDGENPDVLVNAVYINLLLGERVKAARYLDKLRQISPSNPKTYLLSGLMAQEDGNLSRARSLYESAFRADPRDVLAVQSLGDMLMRQKLYGQAVVHFRKALESSPTEPYILERLGSLLVTCQDTTLRDYQQGKEYLERVVVHKASPPGVINSAVRSLALAYTALGDTQKASLYGNYMNDTIRLRNLPF